MTRCFRERVDVAAVVLRLLGIFGLLAASLVHGETLVAPEAALQSLQALAGTDPVQARAKLSAAREQAAMAGRRTLQLGVAEIECRLLLDVDVAEAERNALAALSSAGAEGLPALRLRVCHAAALLSQGEMEAGERELQAVLAASTAAGSMPARALALMERGAQRSKSGDMTLGQQDLLQACELLKAPARHADLTLCLNHLANHYKRIGDLDEAMALYVQLRDKAHAAGARFDESILAYALAEIHFHRGEWPLALAAFTQAAEMSGALGDDAGIAYAESGIGGTLGRMSQPAKALPHVDTALRLLDERADPGHALRNRIMRAKLLSALDRPGESDEQLRLIEERTRAMKDDWLLAQWSSARAEASARLGQWAQAYAALAAWRDLEGRQQQQRLSEQATRLRLQFNRERDAAELQSLRALNEQGEVLRRVQRAALALFVALLIASSAFGVHKVAQSRALKSQASTDELTGLLNRRAILAYAERQMRAAHARQRPLCMLMVDVDHFKRINDVHGHAVGDSVLRHVSRVLPTTLRNADRIGRIGGEEFLVILPDATLTQAASVANRLRELTAAMPMIGPEGEVLVTVSIGAAESTAESESIEVLLARADAALYRAKAGGRNAVFVDGGLDKAHWTQVAAGHTGGDPVSPLTRPGTP